MLDTHRYAQHPLLPQVPQYRNPPDPRKAGGYGAGNNIPVGRSIVSAVLVTRYLCASCGFREEWVDDKAGLEKLSAKYNR